MGIFSEDERSLQNTAILQLIRMKHMVAQLFVQMHKRLVWGENASKLQKKIPIISGQERWFFVCGTFSPGTKVKPKCKYFVRKGAGDPIICANAQKMKGNSQNASQKQEHANSLHLDQ